MVSGQPKSIGIPQVDELSMGPLDLRRRNYNKEKMILMRLKLPKLGFLLELPNLKPNSCHNVSWRRRDMGYEPRQHHEVQVVTTQLGQVFCPSHVATSRRGVSTSRL